MTEEFSFKRYSNFFLDLLGTISLNNTQLVSGSFIESSYVGQAHPLTKWDNISVFHEDASVFKPKKNFTSTGYNDLFEECLQTIKDKQKETKSTYITTADTTQLLKKLFLSKSFWTFSTKGASVFFPPYNFGPYSEGGTKCIFDKDLLKKASVRALF